MFFHTIYFQCDAFKLWLMWKAAGDKGMGERVEKAFDNAHYLLAEVKKRPHFMTVLDEVCEFVKKQEHIFS